LTEDILAIEKTKSVKTKRSIKVLRLTNNGCSFASVKQSPPKTQPRSSKKHSPEQRTTKSQFKPAYAIVEDIVAVDDETFDIEEVPTSSFVVRLVGSGEKTTIGRQIAKGGEGTVFEVPDKGVVAKIYDKKHITRNRYHKLQKMVGNPLKMDGICWPKDMVVNAAGEWCGYIMPRAHGVPIQHQLFIRPRFQNTLPLWNRINLVHFAIGVLEKINFLNKNHVIIGDINPLNILMDGERSFFVDTDSYQIEGYPCPVGTNNYTAPEIQKKDFPTFLRTQENENFAISTLVFMLLIPGKPPYSHQGGGDPVGNIMKREFSYRIKDEEYNGKAPEGPWRFIWSNLPFKIKRAFYATFKNGAYVGCAEWLDLLKEYLYGLEHNPPFYVSTLYPRHFKPISQHARKAFDFSNES